MRTIRDLCTTDAPEDIERSPTLPASPPQALDALCRGRTGAYGSSLYAGVRCGQPPHSAPACGQRHCPPWQQQQAAPWLPNQLDTPLPGVYSLRPCTVPEALRPLCRSHPRLASQRLVSASSQARKRRAHDPRVIGTTRPGFPGILPTGGRPRQSPPHIHSIVPGGGLSQAREAWVPSSTHGSGPVRALAPRSRALFTHERRTAGPLAQIAPHVWTTPWHGPRQAHPNGAPACTSRAPAVFQVAIANRRLVGLHDRLVTCTSRPPGSTRPRTTRLDVCELRCRFLPPVLPAGFMKVRHCGFMHATCRITTDPIRPMLTSPTGAPLPLEPPRCTATPPAQGTWPHWGAPLIS